MRNFTVDMRDESGEQIALRLIQLSKYKYSVQAVLNLREGVRIIQKNFYIGSDNSPVSILWSAIMILPEEVFDGGVCKGTSDLERRFPRALPTV